VVVSRSIPCQTMASAAPTELSAAAIAEKIRGLEATLAAQRAAWRETEAELKAWRKVHQRCVDAAAVAQAGLPAKRAKLEPPPTPPPSPSSSGSSDEDSSNDADDATAGKAVAVELLVANAAAPPSPPPVANAAAPQPPPAPAAPKRAARAAGKRAAKPRGPKVVRVCPPGYNPDGTPAEQCEFGRKVELGLSTAGAPHSHTCPCFRFWQWDFLGPRAEEERAKFEAWKAAGPQ